MNAADANMFVIDATIDRCTHACNVACSQHIKDYISSCEDIDTHGKDRLAEIFSKFDVDRDAKQGVVSLNVLSKEHVSGIMKKHADMMHLIVDKINTDCAACEKDILLHIKAPVLPDVPPNGRVTSAGLRRNAMIHLHTTLKRGISARISVIRRHLQHVYIDKLNCLHASNITHMTGFYASIETAIQKEGCIDIDTSCTQDVSEYIAQPWAIHNHDVTMRGSVSIETIYDYLSHKLGGKVGIIDLPAPKINRVCMYCNTTYTGVEHISGLSSPYTKGVFWHTFLRACPMNSAVRCCDMLVYRRCYDVTLIGMNIKPAEMGELNIIDDNDEYVRSIRKERKSMYDQYRYLEKKSKKSKVSN